MLNELHIENIAVIESADIVFSKGLNVLTGETGAGKSIIIDSINAVLGNRTSKELVRHGAQNAIVSAVFSLENELPWFLDNDIEFDNQVIIQRKISSDGKSSCRVCGFPVTANQLRDLASQLVDIHGQNDGLRLLDEKSHLSFLDSFAKSSNVYDSYITEYRKLVSLSKDIKALTIDDYEKKRLIDTLKGQVDEINKAKIKPGELLSLVSRRDLLRDSEKIRETINNAYLNLAGNDDNVLTALNAVIYYLSKASDISSKFNDKLKVVTDISFNLKDIAESLNDFINQLDFSEDEYNSLESRISLINRLIRKYDTDEKGLIELSNSSQKRLEEIEMSDEILEKKKIQFLSKKEECLVLAEKLSQYRQNSAEELEHSITNELRDLNMSSVRFAVDFQKLEKMCPTGIDDVRFLMSANMGEELGRISKIASGGELSRIMLALKNVFSKTDSVETMIFDEIDSGISGISAQRVAEKLYSVSKNKQVMCVTHLPQIASMADTQFMVSKSEHDGRTFTEVESLSLSNRAIEIARLYGGVNVSDTTLAAAAEQIEKSNQYKEGLN